MVFDIKHFYSEASADSRASINGRRVRMDVLDAIEMAGETISESTFVRGDGRKIFCAEILLPWQPE